MEREEPLSVETEFGERLRQQPVLQNVKQGTCVLLTQWLQEYLATSGPGRVKSASIKDPDSSKILVYRNGKGFGASHSHHLIFWTLE
ncbi:hypothetical protein JEQ12_018864 [Ovis aries]|uniref:Uncharacterized protein n=1 Tax=Ovis aries TaxID=9940 RepID=A0A836ABV4_SHEEP|nr:hypothetical protein JEQ12_018864 [Ovis aries]